MSQLFRRGQIKATLTKFETFLRDFTDTTSNQLRLQQRIDNIKDVFKTLPEITERILEQDPDLQHGDHGEVETELIEKLMDLLAEAEGLKPQNPALNQVERTNSAPLNVLGNQTGIFYDHNLSKMPKRELRKFDGRFEEWKTFSHWFTNTIHNREGMTDGMKLAYLQDTLIGDAAKTIAGLEATNENYREAWELLEQTYNNEEAIISRHFELLSEIPQIKNGSSESLRNLINETLVHVRGMKVLGEPTDHWSTPLLYHTISKLDSITKQEWFRRKVGSQRRSFDDLIKFLREEAIKLQTCEREEPTKQKPNVKPSVSVTTRSQKKSKAVFATMVFKNCPICQQDGHPTFRCEKLIAMTVPQRIQAVKVARLCFNCLRPNHQTNDCRKGNCLKCNKVHHTLLHLNKANPPSEDQSTSKE